MDKSFKKGEKRQYEKEDLPSNPKEWKKWKEERKRQRRLWKENEILKLAEKQHEQKQKETVEDVNTTNCDIEQKKGRDYTVSIALPGSILDNAQSPELRTYLSGQIARAAVVFNVDEIIIFDETGSTDRAIEGEYLGIQKKGQANVQMARILQYLECPQYLRKSFFPQHKDLQYAGLLNPLDCPHHMRATDECEYREGVVLDKPARPGKGSFVNVGLLKDVQIDRTLQPGVRVTVQMLEQNKERKNLKGKVVSPSTPRTEAGIYWGYNVRMAKHLGEVFAGCTYKGGYDLTIGTSDKGKSLDEFDVTDYRHALVVFGGLKGLEASLESDEALDVDDPNYLFQHYLNTCPDQGSRTIRTEEAILITMSALRSKLHKPHTGSSVDS